MPQTAKPIVEKIRAREYRDFHTYAEQVHRMSKEIEATRKPTTKRQPIDTNSAELIRHIFQLHQDMLVSPPQMVIYGLRRHGHSLQQIADYFKSSRNAVYQLDKEARKRIDKAEAN